MSMVTCRRSLSIGPNDADSRVPAPSDHFLPSRFPSLAPLLIQTMPKLIVGAGAAGMSCAEQLSQHPDRFEVTMVEAQGYCGGQAFSIPLPKEKYGADWMNQGVQGGSYIYHHT
jgi:hypothetical protein